MVEIKNAGGRVVAEVRSDAEAVRWWGRHGCTGDYLADTGELVADVARILRLDSESE